MRWLVLYESDDNDDDDAFDDVKLPWLLRTGDGTDAGRTSRYLLVWGNRGGVRVYLLGVDAIGTVSHWDAKLLPS